MKLMLAALAVTFAIAVTASVFAIWPVVADAPWLSDGGDAKLVAENGAAFRENEVARIVQAEVAANASFPSQARTVECFNADYVPGNGKWVVECAYRGLKADDELIGPLISTRSYVFDDATGLLVD